MNNLNPELNNLLRWSIQNSGKAEDKTTTPSAPPKKLDTEVLDALFGGPSDADLMREAITVVKSPDATLENKLVAFDNFEQLIENLDNANNIENLNLWKPLYEELDNPEAQLRSMAAWSIATAIQNNFKSQENFTKTGGIPKLTHMAINDSDENVRKKSILALSSGVRNYQPAFDQWVEALPADLKPKSTDAEDMDAIDTIIDQLRQNSKTKA